VCVFVRLVANMSDRFLQQRINNEFCVKLGKNESDTCAMLSILSQKQTINFITADTTITQQSSHIEITYEDNVHHFLRYQGYCSV
jgi:hypothetical protein